MESGDHRDDRSGTVLIVDQEKKWLSNGQVGEK
jgi:hypothetical protein